MKVARTFFIAIGFMVVAWAGIKEIDAALFATLGIGADSTDSADARMGLAVRRDGANGCEYLVSPWGGITPRLSREGAQICR